MSETNSVASGGLAGVTNSFASAIWALDYLYTLATYRAEGANFHSGGNSLGYSPIYRVSSANGTYAIGAIYYGLLAFADGARNQRLLTVTPPNSTTNPRASYYATLSDDGKTIKMTLLNKDFTNTINASVDVPGATISAASYQTLKPQTDKYDLAANTFYANAQVATDGSFTKGTPSALAVTNATHFSVPIAPMTSVVVTLATATSPIYTVKTGNWNDPTVWSGGQVPTPADAVQLKHTVSLPASYIAQAHLIRYDAAGRLVYGTNAQLKLGF